MSNFDNLKIIIMKYNDIAKDDSNLFFCGICLGEILDNMKENEFKCHHKYHANCFLKLKRLENKKNCILC